MVRKVCVLLAVLAVSSTPAPAQLPLPPFPMPQGTAEERAACAPDVHRFCEQALPDTFRVLHCLQANRSRISRACRQVLERHGQ